MANAKRVAKENDSVFVKRLKEIVGKNATQKEIAGKVGVERATVGYWLSGKITPNSTTLQMIAKAYNVSVNWLIGNTDIKSADPNITTVSSFTGLSEEAVNCIIELQETAKRENIDFIKYLDLLLTNPEIDRLLVAIHQYLIRRQVCDMIKQKFIQIVKNYDPENNYDNAVKLAAAITNDARKTPELYQSKRDLVVFAEQLLTDDFNANASEYMIQKSIFDMLPYFNKEGE